MRTPGVWYITLCGVGGAGRGGGELRAFLPVVVLLTRPSRSRSRPNKIIIRFNCPPIRHIIIIPDDRRRRHRRSSYYDAASSPPTLAAQKRVL